MLTNAALLARRDAAVARGVGHATPIVAARALNAEMWDVEGKRYVDFAGGIAVVNTGHRHPRVMAAVRAEMEKFTHPCFQVTPYESYIALAERLNAIAPVNGPAKSIFFTTGAEATENAVKIARAATGRDGVIAFAGGFHGRTFFAMSMTGKMTPYKKGLGPALPGIWHVPFPVANSGIGTEESLRALDYLFMADVDPSRVAAIIIEPVLGEGGFHEAPASLMTALRRITDAHGIVLIADEVQTGFGRTGKMFAMEHHDARADLICVAKSLAGGLPLSGVVGRAAIMDAAGPGALVMPAIHSLAQLRWRSSTSSRTRGSWSAPTQWAIASRIRYVPWSGAMTFCPSRPFGGRALWLRSTSSASAARSNPTRTPPGA